MSPEPEWANGWLVQRLTASAAEIHGLTPAEDAGPEVWVHAPTRPALVLGSTQPDDLVDEPRAEAAAIDVCHRRSGGGLVHLDPSRDCWIDLIVPRGTAHWVDDVGRAFHWVGDLWTTVLTELLTAALGPLPAEHRPVVHTTGGGTAAGRVWCFADLGHGEVTIGESKVVGLSQRRTRQWSRIQCLVLARWDAETLSPLVDTEAMIRHRPAWFGAVDPAELDADRVVAGFPPGIDPPAPESLAAGFLAALPAP